MFNPGERKVLATRRLDSAYKIFARNNSDFLYYGTQSAIGDDGFRRWVLQGFDIRRGEWLADSLNLPDTVGSEIDATICFEIIDGYFCALTNHTSFEMDKIEYTAYYDFLRFPLDRPSHEHIERPTKRNLFRRQHAEGPIDDRWTFMKIFWDELSGELRILESRKEWLSGNSSATRTYYTKTLHMTKRSDEVGTSSSSDEEEDDDQYPEDDRLAQFLGTATKNNRGHPPTRDPSEMHVGDDGSSSVMFTLSKCFIRSYHPASQSFLDLVDDPIPSGDSSQRIRIRVGTRLPRALSEQDKSSKSDGALNLEGQDAVPRPDGTPEQSEVASWPPDAAPAVLDSILNPPGYVGNVQGTWDQRSLIYASGGGANGGVKALVLISFDPSIHLRGVRSFDDRRISSPSEGNLATTLRNIQASLSPVKDKSKEMGKGKGKEKDIAYGCVMDLDEEVVVEHKSSASSGKSGLIGQRQASEDQVHAWAAYEPAQYLAIGQGFHFAK